MAAVAVITALAACGGSGQTPVARVTPTLVTSPSPEVSASPTPTATPVTGLCDAGHHCLALVTLRGSDNLVVRDITDLNHPRTVSSLGALAISGAFGETTIHFVSGTELSYPLNGGIVTVPLSGSPTSPVAGAAKDAGDPAWSPDGTEVVYMTQSGSIDAGNERIDIHLLRSGADRVVGTVPSLGVGGCETIESCTVPNWLDTRLAFSPDGKWFSYVAQGFGSTALYVWSSDGSLLKSDTEHVATMSAWSAESLYFRFDGGVTAWHDGATSTFLSGVAWIRPSASPAGGQVVYTVRGAGGWGHVYLADTSTGKVRELKAQRTDARFLTSRYVWYAGERACVAADICGPNPPFHPSNGKTYIYDLQTGTEYESIITNVYDVWPHAA